MATTELDPADLTAAIAAFPADRPVYMVNLLRFRPQAEYPDGSDAAAGSGQDAYLTRYLPAFTIAVKPYGGSELVFAGLVVANLVGPVDDTWDAVGVVRYPNIKAFHDLVHDDRYLTTAEPHRRAALAGWRLYATTALA
jgi:uncharacterized protein (DUF1330 family)